MTNNHSKENYLEELRQILDDLAKFRNDCANSKMGMSPIDKATKLQEYTSMIEILENAMEEVKARDDVSLKVRKRG